MAFDLQLWKKELTLRLQGWRERMGEAGVKSSYYFITASTFLPIVHSYQAGNIEPLLFASVASGIGANLLSNIIQNWKDEATAAEQLQDAVSSEPALQEKLDHFLDELGVLRDAEFALAESDKAWFVENIQHELAQLNSRLKYEYNATLNGDGAIALGDGTVAIGAGGIYAKGDLIVNQIPDSTKADDARVKGARHAYLTSLYRRCQSLPLVALGDDPNVRDDVTLDDVYIDLNTITIQEFIKNASDNEKKMGVDGVVRRPEKAKAVTGFEAFLQTPKLVLLGDPGSGKSTFVRNLLAMQAQVLRGKRDPLEGVEPDLLPVLVTLRDLIKKLSEIETQKKSAERRDAHFVKIVDEQIIADLEHLYRSPAFEEGMCKSLADGRVLLALDGLDEVPEHLREKVRQAVAAYQKAYALPRIVMTCRIRSYRGTAEQPGFSSYTLAPFTQKQAQKFCLAWYDSQVHLEKLEPEKAKERAADLAGAAWRDDLKRLSENPMLLTTMAIIHQKETRLPNERVKLYGLAVRILIERWQKHRFGEQLAVSEALSAVLKDEKRVRKILERLAYEAHRIGKKNDKKDEADLLRKDALEILEGSTYLGDMVLASELLDYVDLRSGLLVGRGGEPGKPSAYSFAHRTFQEYLAGCYLINQRDAARQLLAHAAEPQYWSLAVEFGSEELFYNGRTESQNDVLDLAYALLSDTCKTTERCRTALWSAKMAGLVGLVAIQNDSSPQGGESYLKRLLSTILNLLESDLTPVERADAGCVLAKLGDPRPEVLHVDAMPLCYIPAGPYLMGSEEGEGNSDERPQHKVTLPAYWVSQYPITNAQFDEFVQGGGYQDPGFWPEAKTANIWQDGAVKAWNDNELRTAAYDFGEPYNLSNHPVVGVTWYEMLAFTRWLTVRWHGQEILPPGWQVLLPSEAEWEKAARGGLKVPQQMLIRSPRGENGSGLQNPTGNCLLEKNILPARAYPWDDDFNPDFANTSESGIGTTSAVGCFQGGSSPYGVLDLVGNVWEWTRTIWNTDKFSYPYKSDDGRENISEETGKDPRVLRGGSCLANLRDARCARRSRYFPGFRSYLIGFRVVVSPCEA